MALPGDCPVKQSSTRDLLREKGAGEKKKNSGSLQNSQGSPEPESLAASWGWWWQGCGMWMRNLFLYTRKDGSFFGSSKLPIQVYSACSPVPQTWLSWLGVENARKECCHESLHARAFYCFQAPIKETQQLRNGVLLIVFVSICKATVLEEVFCCQVHNQTLAQFGPGYLMECS